MNMEKIKSQEDIDLIRKRGYYGDPADLAIGNYYKYLGPSDGGFIVKSATKVESRDDSEMELG